MKTNGFNNRSILMNVDHWERRGGGGGGGWRGEFNGFKTVSKCDSTKLLRWICQ